MPALPLLPVLFSALLPPALPVPHALPEAAHSQSQDLQQIAQLFFASFSEHLNELLLSPEDSAAQYLTDSVNLSVPAAGS